MNVAIIGSGCIGLYVGGLLSSVSGLHTRIVGRERIQKDIEEEKQLIITKENGKTIVNSTELNFVTEINNETMSDQDIILIAVKSFDTKFVAESLTRCNLKKGCTTVKFQISYLGTVISLQNSVQNAEILREVFVKHYLAVKMAKKRDPSLGTKFQPHFTNIQKHQTFSSWAEWSLSTSFGNHAIISTCLPNLYH